MSLPWREILDYLAEVGGERTPHGLCWKALRGLERLVPHDCGVLHRTNPRREILEGSGQYGLSDAVFEQYRNYYVHRDPARAGFPQGAATVATEWRKLGRFEIVTDFLRPNRVNASAGVLLYDHRGELYANLNVHRTGRGVFTERDEAVFKALQPHLSNLLANLTVGQEHELDAYHWIEATPGCRLLSRREAEVARLVCRRLSAAQIGSVLGISRRTVERHLEHIYGKLDVHSRQELLRRLFDDPDRRGPTLRKSA